MNIALLKHVGKIGVILGWKKLLPDGVKFEIGEDGILTIGNRSKQTDDGSVIFYEYEFVLGSNKVEFTSKDGTIYRCGTISRSGRFIQVTNELDELVTALAVAYEKQAEEIESLRAEIAEKEKQRAIKII
jgi:hypothetical protein